MPTIRARARAVVALAALALATAPRAAAAQNAAPPSPTPPAQSTVDEAHAHFDRGLTLLNAQNFEGALAEFQRSYELNARPSVLYNIAVTQQALHRYPEAAHTLEQYLRDATNLNPQRRAEIQQALEQIRALIAHVTVDVAPQGAAVRVDNVTVGTSPLAAPVEVGPGRHAVEVLVGGRPAGRAEFTIASGESRTVHVDVAVPSSAAESENPYGDSVPVAAPRPTLRVEGVPAGAELQVDGARVEGARAGEALELAPGAHQVVVRAPGRAEYRGAVALRDGEHRTLDVHLAAAPSGLPAPVFYGGAIATVALGAAAAVFGGLTLATRAEFDGLYQDDPTIGDVAARGNTYRDATNGLLIATGVVGIATAVIFTQTRFSAPSSTADVAVAPLPGGAAASVRVRF